MSRYIDADLLLKNLKSQYGEDFGWQCTVNMSDVGMMIEDAPAADVQEVKHGHWVQMVKIKKGREVRLVHWQCSLCGCFLGTNTANYCPNCGAKMRGETK